MGFELKDDDFGSDLTPQQLEGLASGLKLPPGKYHCRVEALEEVVSSKGNDGIQFTFLVLAGPAKGETIEDTLWFTDGTAGRKQMFMCSLGLKMLGSDGKYHKNPKVASWLDTIGAEVILEVEVETFKRDNGSSGQKSKVAFGGMKNVNDPKAREDCEMAGPASTGGDGSNGSGTAGATAGNRPRPTLGGLQGASAIPAATIPDDM